MIRIGIVGDIGSGKTHIAKSFGLPVFNADYEVAKLYKKNKKVFLKLKKNLPLFINSFPLDKKEISAAILKDKKNLKKIIKIIHFEIRKKLTFFLKKNKNKKMIVLDIPLLLENKINNKSDILIFVQSKKLDILKRLKGRPNYNQKLLRIFRNIQLPLDYKKKKSLFVIKNDFKKKYVKLQIRNILKEIS
jgi:dephospho-CoA kinase